MKIQMNFAFGSVSLLLRRRDALKHKVFMQVCIFLLLLAKEILDLAQGVLCLKFILLGDHEGGEAFLITYELLNIAGMSRFPLVSCTATSADNANLNPGVAVDDSPG